MLGSGLCLGLGSGNPATPGWGLGWVCLVTVCSFASLFPARVRGVCGWAWVSACTPPVLVRVVGRAWLCARSSCSPPIPGLVCGLGVCAGVWVAAASRLTFGRCCWGVCAVVRVPLLPPPFLGGRLWRGGVRVLLLVGCAPPLLFGLFLGGFVVSVAGCPGLGSPGLCPPVPSLPGRVVCCLCFFFPSVVCFRVFWVSVLLVGRCPQLGVAGFGWVVPRRPFRGSYLWCRLGGQFGRLLWCWWGVWWLWAVLAPPPPLSVVLFWGGGLPVPPSAFRGLAHALVGILCGFPVCCWWFRFASPCPGPMYTLGSAPLPAGVGSGSAGRRLCQAALCGPGLAVSLRLRGAGFYLPAAACVDGPLPLLPGVCWPFAGVWRAGAVPSGVCGGLFWLAPRLASLAWCCAEGAVTKGQKTGMSTHG